MYSRVFIILTAMTAILILSPSVELLADSGSKIFCMRSLSNISGRGPFYRKQLADWVAAGRLSIAGALQASRGNKGTTMQNDHDVLLQLLVAVIDYPQRIKKIDDALERIGQRELAISIIKGRRGLHDAPPVDLPGAVNLVPLPEGDPYRIENPADRIEMGNAVTTVKQFDTFPVERLIKEETETRDELRKVREHADLSQALFIYLLEGVAGEISSDSTAFKDLQDVLKTVHEKSEYRPAQKLNEEDVKMGMRTRIVMGTGDTILKLWRFSDSFVQGAAKPLRNYVAFIGTLTLLFVSVQKFSNQTRDFLYGSIYETPEMATTARHESERESLLNIARLAKSRGAFKEKVWQYLVDTYPDVATSNGFRIAFGQPVRPGQIEEMPWDIPTAVRVISYVIEAESIMQKRLRDLDPIPAGLDRLGGMDHEGLHAVQSELSKALKWQHEQEAHKSKEPKN